MAEGYDVLIVGGGHAGAQAALVLRQQGFRGSVAILGEEPYAPYDRPPLSKEYLSGEKQFERMLLRTPQKWAELQVDLLLGERAEAVEPEVRRVTTASGQQVGYGKLIWATGGSPRRLVCSGAELSGVHTVRNRADVDRMIAEMAETEHVVVIGGGYIGLEAAAVLRKFGKKVTVLEALDRVLARVAGEPLSRFYEAEHRAHGVDIRLGISVECIEEREGRVCGVRLADGSILAAQMAIVGIGISAEITALATAGAEVGNGVRVDQLCRTSLSDIYAVGDCAEHRNQFAGGAWIRLESVQNANDQATTAAKAICGIETPYQAVPWFWSNQYDLRLQTVGISRGYDGIVMRGEPATRSFSLIYLKQGKAIAIDCVNATRDYVQGRQLITKGTVADPADLANAALPLKDIAGAGL